MDSRGSAEPFFAQELRRLDIAGEQMRLRVAPGAPSGSNRIVSGNMFVNQDAKRIGSQSGAVAFKRSASTSVAAGAATTSTTTANAQQQPQVRRSAACTATPHAAAAARAGAQPFSSSLTPQLNGNTSTRSATSAIPPSAAAAILISQQQQQQYHQQSSSTSRILQPRPIPGKEHAAATGDNKTLKKKRKKKKNGDTTAAGVGNGAPDVSAISRQRRNEMMAVDGDAGAAAALNAVPPVSARLSAASGLFRPEYQEDVMLLSARGSIVAQQQQQQRPHQQQQQRATSSHYYTRRPGAGTSNAAAAGYLASPQQQQQQQQRSASAGSRRANTSFSSPSAAAQSSVMYNSTSRPQISSSVAHRFSPREALDAAFVRSDSSVVVPECGIPRRLSHVHNLREDTETRIARCLRSGFHFSDVPSAEEQMQQQQQQLNQSSLDAHQTSAVSAGAAARATLMLFEQEDGRSLSVQQQQHRSASAAAPMVFRGSSPSSVVAPPQGSALQCFLENPPPCTFAVSAGRKTARSQLNFIASSPHNFSAANNNRRSVFGGSIGSGTQQHDASTRRDLSIGISPRPNINNGNNHFISTPSSHNPSRSASAARPVETVATEEHSDTGQKRTNVPAVAAASSSSPPNIITSPRYDRYDLFPTSSALFKRHRSLVEAAEAVTRLTPEDFVSLYRNIFAADDTERFRVPPLVSSVFAAAAALHREETLDDRSDANGEAHHQQHHRQHQQKTLLPSPIDFTGDCLSPMADTDDQQSQSIERKQQRQQRAQHQQQQMQQEEEDDEIFIRDDLSPGEQAREYSAQVAARQQRRMLQEQQQQHSAARQLNLTTTAVDDTAVVVSAVHHVSDAALGMADAGARLMSSSPRLRRIIDLNDMSPERYCLYTTAWAALWCVAVALDLPCIAAYRKYNQDLVLPRRPSLHELQSEFFGGTQLSIVGPEQERDPNFEPKVCTVATKIVATTVEFEKGLTRAHAARLDTAIRHATRWILEAVTVREEIAAAYRAMGRREEEEEEEERQLASISPVSASSRNNNNHNSVDAHAAAAAAVLEVESERKSNIRSSVSPRSPDQIPRPVPLHTLPPSSRQQQQQQPECDTARTNQTVETTITTTLRENSLEAALEQVRPYAGDSGRRHGGAAGGASEEQLLNGEGEAETLLVAKTVLRWAVEVRDASVRLLK